MASFAHEGAKKIMIEGQIKALTEIILEESEDVDSWLDHSLSEGVELALHWLVRKGFLTTVSYEVDVDE